MSETATVHISAARRQLFDLFESVVQRTRSKVIIERRNRPEKAVLTSEAYLRHLEQQVRDLTHALSRISEPSPGPYNFLGSVKSDLPVDEILQQGRAEQERLTGEKMARLWTSLQGGD